MTVERIPNGFPRPVAARIPGGYKKADPFYSSGRWQSLRKLVLAEEPVCRLCATRSPTHVDHLDNDTCNNHRWNLQPLCPECHSWKTAKFNVDGNVASVNDEAALRRLVRRHSGGMFYPQPYVCDTQWQLVANASYERIKIEAETSPHLLPTLIAAFDAACEGRSVAASLRRQLMLPGYRSAVFTLCLILSTKHGA